MINPPMETPLLRHGLPEALGGIFVILWGQIDLFTTLWGIQVTGHSKQWISI
jgi:hypothetical protein